METQSYAGLPLFSGLNGEDIERIIRAAHTRELEPENFVFFQEDPATELFLLTRGRVKLFQMAPDGQQNLMRIISAGSLFAIVSLVENSKYPVTAQAAEASQVLVWNQRAIQAMLEKYPRLAVNAMQLFAEQVREYQDRFREIATERVERRLARALLRLTAQSGVKNQDGILINFPLSRQDLAEMTGATLFTVSRILSQWETNGLVISGRERITIRQPHGLVQIAEDLPAASTGKD